MITVGECREKLRRVVSKENKLVPKTINQYVARTTQFFLLMSTEHVQFYGHHFLLLSGIVT